jgi:hypothetical protein
MAFQGGLAKDAEATMRAMTVGRVAPCRRLARFAESFGPQFPWRSWRCLQRCLQLGHAPCRLEEASPLRSLRGGCLRLLQMQCEQRPIDALRRGDTIGIEGQEMDVLQSPTP